MDTYDFLVNGAEIAIQYQNSNDADEKHSLIMKIFTGVYFNINKLLFGNKGEDFNSDFALYFYDKIPSLLQNYNPRSSSFLTYLMSYVKFQSKSFSQEQMVKRNTDEVILSEERFQVLAGMDALKNEGRYNLYAAEASVSYGKDEPEVELPKIKCRHKPAEIEPKDKGHKIKLKKDRSFYFSMSYKNRFIFLLACKSCMFLDDAMVAKIAKEIDLPVEKLDSFLERLRFDCVKSQARIDKMIARRNSHYVKMKAAEKILGYADEELSTIYCRSVKSHAEHYKGWMYANKKDKKQIKFPSNRTIGKYLNINKTSVANNLEKALKELYT